jgi:8-oxo-dGTP diphosphatase
MMSDNPLRVTAALLVHNQKILIAQRNNTGRFANKWEFPGGKIDPGETPQECLQRELQEELGLTATIGDLFSETLYCYDQGKIRQYTYWASAVTPATDLRLSEHQAIAWVLPQEMVNYEFAGADLAVANLLQEQITSANAHIPCPRL